MSLAIAQLLDARQHTTAGGVVRQAINTAIAHIESTDALVQELKAKLNRYETAEELAALRDPPRYIVADTNLTPEEREKIIDAINRAGAAVLPPGSDIRTAPSPVDKLRTDLVDAFNAEVCNVAEDSALAAVLNNIAARLERRGKART